MENKAYETRMAALYEALERALTPPTPEQVAAAKRVFEAKKAYKAEVLRDKLPEVIGNVIDIRLDGHTRVRGKIVNAAFDGWQMTAGGDAKAVFAVRIKNVVTVLEEVDSGSREIAGVAMQLRGISHRLLELSLQIKPLEERARQVVVLGRT